MDLWVAYPERKNKLKYTPDRAVDWLQSDVLWNLGHYRYTGPEEKKVFFFIVLAFIKNSGIFSNFFKQVLIDYIRPQGHITCVVFYNNRMAWMSSD